MRAVVIGAASGIGREAARALRARGYAIVVADVLADELSRLAHELGAEAAALDITDTPAVAELATRLGPVDCLVITAGLSASMASFERIIAVNLVGTAAAIDSFAPFVQPGGAIICTASISGHMAAESASDQINDLLDAPDTPALAARLQQVLSDAEATPGMAYALSKLGILRLVRRKASQFGRQGVRICSVSPGCIDTPMGNLEMDATGRARAAIPLGPIPRAGSPAEPAAAMVFLASREASFITGCDLLVDGGWIGTISAHGSDSPLGQVLTAGQAK